jgi:hypothetical protein
LEEKQLGSRTNYSVPEHYKETINILTAANLSVTIAKEQNLHFSQKNTHRFFKPSLVFIGGMSSLGLLLKLTRPTSETSANIMLFVSFVILIIYYKSVAFKIQQSNRTQNFSSATRLS